MRVDLTPLTMQGEDGDIRMAPPEEATEEKWSARSQSVHVRLHTLFVFVRPMSARLLITFGLRPRHGRCLDFVGGFSRSSL